MRTWRPCRAPFPSSCVRTYWNTRGIRARPFSDFDPCWRQAGGWLRLCRIAAIFTFAGTFFLENSRRTIAGCSIAPISTFIPGQGGQIYSPVAAFVSRASSPLVSLLALRCLGGTALFPSASWSEFSTPWRAFGRPCSHINSWLWHAGRRLNDRRSSESSCGNAGLQCGQDTPHDLCRPAAPSGGSGDRKSTRLNSSHLVISYAVFCLKKKKRLLAKTPI